MDDYLFLDRGLSVLLPAHLHLKQEISTKKNGLSSNHPVSPGPRPGWGAAFAGRASAALSCLGLCTAILEKSVPCIQLVDHFSDC